MFKKLTLFILLLFISRCFAQALSGGGEKYPDLHTNAASLENWRAMRFGMFIHW
ncbi:MAG: alpha-L-fucosidase, partial [Calditrichaeota bacterium]